MAFFRALAASSINFLPWLRTLNTEKTVSIYFLSVRCEKSDIPYKPISLAFAHIQTAHSTPSLLTIQRQYRMRTTLIYNRLNGNPDPAQLLPERQALGGQQILLRHGHPRRRHARREQLGGG